MSETKGGRKKREVNELLCFVKLGMVRSQYTWVCDMSILAVHCSSFICYYSIPFMLFTLDESETEIFTIWVQNQFTINIHCNLLDFGVIRCEWTYKNKNVQLMRFNVKLRLHWITEMRFFFYFYIFVNVRFRRRHFTCVRVFPLLNMASDENRQIM